MKRAIEDMESFTGNTPGPINFVYRFGTFTNVQDEGVIIGLFDGENEDEIKRRIAILDRKFHSYTDTRVEIEYDEVEDCWYCTYAVLYPFDNKGAIGGNSKPLF